MKRLLGLAVFLLAGSALASFPFETDFERGLANAGFDTVNAPGAADSVFTSPLAAHRGDAGLRVVDGTSASTQGTGPSVVVNLGGGRPVYARFWMRVTSLDPGTVYIVQLISSGGSVNSIEDVSLSTPDGTLGSAGADASGAYPSEAHGPVFPVSGWHLVEMNVFGVGSTSGARQVWLDGALQVERTKIDWRGLSAFRFNFGEPWANNRSQVGTLDFDDLRLSDAPMASRLAWSEQRPGASGCRAFTLMLVDSTGSPAPAPYPVEASLGGSAGVTFYADADCSRETRTTTLNPGSAKALVFARATGLGAKTLTAAQVDFLSAPLQTSGDGTQPSAVTRLYDIGCSGTGGPESFAAWALLAASALGLRRRAPRVPGS